MKNKKILITFSIIFFLDLFASGQKPFSRMYDIYGHWENFSSVLSVDSNNYLLTGHSQNLLVNDSSKYGLIFITKINNESKIEKTGFINKNYHFMLSPILVTNKTKQKIVFGLIDTLSALTYKIVDYDSSLQFYNEKKIQFSSNIGLTNSSVPFMNNKLYFFCGDRSERVASRLKLSIQCMDTNGNLIWGKVFNDKKCYTKNVVQTSDGNFILAGLKYYQDLALNRDSSFGWYAKVDTLGNILWDHTLKRESPFLADDFIACNANGNIYLAGSILAFQGNHPFDLHRDSSYCSIAKINESNGEIIWYKQLFTVREKIQGLFSIINSLTYHKGSLYGLIYYSASEREIPNDLSEYIMLAKFDLEGNILWKRLFSQSYQSNRAYSLTPVADGFLICADGKDSTRAKGDADAWLIKTDSNGCIIPGCNTKDGIVQIINPEKVFTVYPNPAQNEINVSTENLNIKIESLAVYNLQGQLFKTVSKTTKVSTEDLANGNYLLIITTNKQQMAGKKFVVER